MVFRNKNIARLSFFRHKKRWSTFFWKHCVVTAFK